MNIVSLTDTALLERIGNKVKSRRTANQLSQAKLAESASVSLSSVQYIEAGRNVSILILVQVLRALRSLDLLESLTEDEPISPIAYAKMLKKEKHPQRIRKSKEVKQNPTTTW